MYLPSNAKVRAFKAAIQTAAKATCRKPIAGPVRVVVEATFSRPKSHRKADDTLRDTAPTFPGKNCGDNDNIEKAVWDSLSTIAFLDDSQIVSNSCDKQFGPRDRLVVSVTPWTPREVA